MIDSGVGTILGLREQLAFLKKQVEEMENELVAKEREMIERMESGEKFSPEILSEFPNIRIGIKKGQCRPSWKTEWENAIRELGMEPAIIEREVKARTPVPVKKILIIEE